MSKRVGIITGGLILNTAEFLLQHVGLFKDFADARLKQLVKDSRVRSLEANEVVNRGAHEAGGASYGLNITLPHEQKENPYVYQSIEFQYFFTRKVCLVEYSCAFIVMPGGLGTLDELFEAATLIQCRKIGPFPLILMGSKFWQGMREWGQTMMRAGVFARDEIGFGYVTDSPKKAVDLVVRSLPATLKARLKPRR